MLLLFSSRQDSRGRTPGVVASATLSYPHSAVCSCIFRNIPLRLHAHTCCRLILGTPFGRQDCTDEPEEGNEDPDDPQQNVSFAESEQTHCEKTEKVDAEKDGCKNPIKYCHVIKLLTSVECSTCRVRAGHVVMETLAICLYTSALSIVPLRQKHIFRTHYFCIPQER